MRRLWTVLCLFLIGVLVYVSVPMAQPTGWLSFIVQDPQGTVRFRALGSYGQPVMIGKGTALPTAANSGAGPVDGEYYTIEAAGAEPVTRFFSQAANAWRTIPTSTLATNAVDVANSVWLGQNSVNYEGATANAFEQSLVSSDVGQDSILGVPDVGEAGGSFVMTLLDTALNDVGDATAIWFAANQMVVEGATANGFETQVIFGDPDRDLILAAPGSVDGILTLTRAGGGGYYGGKGVPNPWRLDFIDTLGNCIALLNDQSAVAGPADTNVNNVVCATGSFEFRVEQAAAGVLAALLAPNANGWLIELDDTNDEGIEGRLFGGDAAVNDGWHLVAGTDAGYIEASLSVADSSETDQVLVGFMLREAYDGGAVYTNYNTYCSVGIADAVADPRSIMVAEEADGDAGAATDTLIDIVDGTAIRLRVEIDAGGQCDVYVNNVLTNLDVMGAGLAADGFDAADYVVPFITVLNSAGDGTPDPDVIFQYVEVGFLN